MDQGAKFAARKMHPSWNEAAEQDADTLFQVGKEFVLLAGRVFERALRGRRNKPHEGQGGRKRAEGRATRKRWRKTAIIAPAVTHTFVPWQTGGWVCTACFCHVRCLPSPTAVKFGCTEAAEVVREFMAKGVGHDIWIGAPSRCRVFCHVLSRVRSMVYKQTTEASRAMYRPY